MMATGSSAQRLHIGVVMVLAVPGVLSGCLALLSPGRTANLWLRSIILLWLSSLFFLTWRHGFTREEFGHLDILLAFMPLLALAPEGLPTTSPRFRMWARVSGALCGLSAIYTLQSMFLTGSFAAFLARPVLVAGRNLVNVARFPEFASRMRQAEQSVREDAALPTIRRMVGSNRVDVFGYHQTYAVFNHLSYHPRPVFQSYAAYNHRLMELNEQHFLSSRGPDYVLFRLLPIDRRFPPFEDARVLRHLLINFEMTEEEKGMLLLKARSRRPARLSLLKEEMLPLHGRISLTEYKDQDLWIEIDLKPSVKGSIRQVLYKPPKVRLAIWPNSEQAHALFYRAPPVMMAAGFVISPLLLDTRSVADFLSTGRALRSDALSVLISSDTASCWRSMMSFKLYRIDNLRAATTPEPPTNGVPH
jgi:hypothetical protein